MSKQTTEIKIEKLNMEAKPYDKVLAKVAELCPAAVQNGKVDFERLKTELADVVDENTRETYEFKWVGKNAAMVEANKPIRKTLRPCKEESKNWDTTENLYIEGDNLEVLKLLEEGYLGKIKMIYIDPPYNTGNDFVYRDNRVQSEEEMNKGIGLFDEEDNRLLSSQFVRNTETSGRFHSDWCNMIYPRLKLARNLLTDDGVIFISIDDNEQANLKKICDEVFGEENFVTTLHVEMSTTQGMKVGAAQNGNIVKNGEYILIYSKKRQKNIAVNLLYDTRKFDNHYTYFYNGTTYAKLKDIILNNTFLSKQIENSGLKNSTIEEWFNSNNNVKQFILDNSEFIFQDGNCNISMTQNEINSINSNFPIEIQKDNKKYIVIKTSGKNIRQLIPLSISIGYANDFYKTYGLRKIRGDFWKEYYLDMGNISKEGEINFENGKKPVRLIKDIIKLSTRSRNLILDFFSGSATTAHAVMQLNAENGGKRKFILVQLPEECKEDSEAYKQGFKNICEIGKERIRRAGEKIVQETGKTDLDIGFRVLRVDDSNMQDVYYNPAELKQADLLSSVDNIKADRTPLDLLFGVMVEWGVSLSLPLQEIKVGSNTIHIVGDNDLVACFDKKISTETITKMAEFKPTRVVFRDSCFEKDDEKINMFEIFKTICHWDDKQAKDNVRVM